MSNIYIQEPPTDGKVILKTTAGDIDIELWSKECPKACRNFVQLCMEGYYDNTIFHRIIPEFIVQGGDPTGTGEGGESIYGQPFKDEFHQRLRFTRRGLVAMANAAKDDNASQFFFTLGPCIELQKKHTIFAKVAGNTIYNMIKLADVELEGERPVKPHKILSTEVISNPFQDIVPRNLPKKVEQKPEIKEDKSKSRAIKNYGLLSFGAEAEFDEDEISNASKELQIKVKSSHDIGKPSKKKVDKEEKEKSNEDEDKSDIEEEEMVPHEDVDIEKIKSKLKKAKEDEAERQKIAAKKAIESANQLNDKQLKAQKLKEEIKQLSKELVQNKKAKKDEVERKQKEKEQEQEQDEIVKKYKEDVDKYEHLKRKKLMNAKEEKTMELLKSFKDRLFNAKFATSDDGTETTAKSEDAAAATTADTTPKAPKDDLQRILTHKLDIDDEIKQKVIDANVYDNERYDIFDPRNSMNKRKREISKEVMKDRKKHSSK